MHRSAMDDVMPTIQALAHRMDANGYRSVGYNRELCIGLGEDRGAWVTKLQEPIGTSRKKEKRMQSQAKESHEAPLFQGATATVQVIRRRELAPWRAHRDAPRAVRGPPPSLFSGVRGRGVLQSPYAGCYITLIIRCQKRPIARAF